MISKITTDSDLDKFRNYFLKNEEDETSELWKKVKPKFIENKTAAYLVKTFKYAEKLENASNGDHFQEEEPESPDSLPYDLVVASPAFDIWSFGSLLYTLFTDTTLFKLNRKDDLVNVSAMEELYNWDEEKNKKYTQRITIRVARKLVSKLLQRDLPD
eukprot:731170-Ditylum_brightwellii.AAC.1